MIINFKEHAASFKAQEEQIKLSWFLDFATDDSFKLGDPEPGQRLLHFGVITVYVKPDEKVHFC